MSTIDFTTAPDVEDDPAAFVAWAAELGAGIAPYAAAHDRDGTFVSEAFDLFKSSGYLALAVPTELGGRGATIRQVAAAQRELAKHCGSSALAVSMHHHVTLFTAWRYRRGLPGAEATLRRIADEGIVLVSTGGADFTRPRGTAVPVDGGYRVSGRKVFASQVPAGDVFSTMFVLDDNGDGPVILNMAVPVRADGVTVLDNWDTLGMRGTGSHDVEIRDVFVPEDKVLARRPYGVVDAPLQVIISNAFPVIGAVYLGIAEAARDAALGLARKRPADAALFALFGEMENALATARMAHRDMVEAADGCTAPGPETTNRIMIARTLVGRAAVEVVEKAMEAVGGSAFYRAAGLERLFRDVQGARFHRPQQRTQLELSGRLALGLGFDAQG